MTTNQSSNWKDGAETKKTKEAPKKKQAKSTIREYTDWNHGKTFAEKPIQIERDKYRITQIRKYIQTERKRRISVRTKQGLNGRITHSRKMEKQAVRSDATETTGSSQQQ